MIRAVAAAALALAASVGVFGRQDLPSVREARTVTVAGHQEVWSLEWKSAPQSACAEDDIALTCPCSGFAYGEQGDLELVRRGPGGLNEHLDLSQFFDGEFPAPGRTAVVARWPIRDADSEAFARGDARGLFARIRARAPVRVMTFRDYDGDGRASEFFLQVAAAPCGKRMGVVLGLSGAREAVHAFTSVAHPERPLILRVDQWDALSRARGAIASVDWRCGDHGSETQEEVRLDAAAGRISATRRFYACGADGKRGALLRTEPQ